MINMFNFFLTEFSLIFYIICKFKIYKLNIVDPFIDNIFWIVSHY